jgi:peptidoglycan/LPS O-acetylase OafA/YrhL
MSKATHQPQLDGIRGIMAWWVVFGHLANYFGLSHLASSNLLVRIITLTSVPVDVFICISGFVIFAALSKTTSLREYGINRFFRIYPVYFIILIVAIFSEPIRLIGTQAAEWTFDFGHNQQVIIQQGSLTYFTHIALHFLLLHGVIPDQILMGSGSKFIGPAWSLSLEWQFYLCAPAFYFIAKKSTRGILLTMLAFAIIKAALVQHGLTFSYGAFLPIKIEMFCLGMMTFHFVSGNMARQTKPDQVVNGILLLAVLFIGAYYAAYSKASVISYAVWAAICLTFLTKTKSYPIVKYIKKILSSHALSYIGTRSYSTYLLHLLIIQGLSCIALKAGALPQEPSQAFMTGFSLIVILSTLLCSILLYTHIELPFMKAGKAYNANSKRIN